MSNPSSSNGGVTTKKKTIMPIQTSFLFRTVTVGAVQTIVTHNIIGKNDLDIEKLKGAVYRLVDRNPILSGVLLHGTKATTGGSGIFLETGHYDSFVNVIPTPANMPSPTEHGDIHNAVEMMEYVQEYIEPVVPPSTKGPEEISKKLPVFGVDVMELPNGYMYYAPRMSHVIGDGRTYYMVIEELDAILNSKKLPPFIVWGTQIAQEFDFTHQKTSLVFWIILILAHVVYAIVGFPPTQNITLSKAKIEAKKKELIEKFKAKGEGQEPLYLSTNDIVTAALCESVCNMYACVNQSVDYRFGRWPGIGDRFGGIFARLVPLKTAMGKDPMQVRTLVDSIGKISQHLLDLPVWATTTGSFYNQTNWACLKRTLEGTIFHAPSQTVVKEVPVAQVIIHQPNDTQVGVMHKLRNVDPTVGLLSELIE